jgi:hypothetical protein
MNQGQVIRQPRIVGPKAVAVLLGRGEVIRQPRIVGPKAVAILLGPGEVPTSALRQVAALEQRGQPGDTLGNSQCFVSRLGSTAGSPFRQDCLVECHNFLEGRITAGRRPNAPGDLGGILGVVAVDFPSQVAPPSGGL